MITLTEIRELKISADTARKQPLHISAASGLVCVNSTIYVVADDELHLGVFSTNVHEPGRLFRLFEGVLPGTKVERKRQKPDLEALTLIPAFENFPHCGLLAFGSASRPNRRRGALLSLDRNGAVCGPPQELDMSPAIIRYSLSQFLDAVQSAHANPIEPIAIHRLNLGLIEGVPFCFTDAAALPKGDMVFCAVAEDTEDAYRDGPCIGAAVGIVMDICYPWSDLTGHTGWRGISARGDGDRLDLLLVTDADDPAIPALLLSIAK